MKEAPQEIIRIADILEQLYELEKVLVVHRDADDQFMVDQYIHRKEKLSNELAKLFHKLNLNPGDWAA